MREEVWREMCIQKGWMETRVRSLTEDMYPELAGGYKSEEDRQKICIQRRRVDTRVRKFD